MSKPTQKTFNDIAECVRELRETCADLLAAGHNPVIISAGLGTVLADLFSGITPVKARRATVKSFSKCLQQDTENAASRRASDVLH